MTDKNNAATFYANVFKHWPKVGAKPTAGQLATIHALGARPGKQALASAMALRDSGVTGAQIVMACGAPQLNKMRGFTTDGLAKFVAMPFSPEGHKVYRLELTSKGKAKVAKASAAAQGDKPAKPATPAPQAPVQATSEQPQATA